MCEKSFCVSPFSHDTLGLCLSLIGIIPYSVGSWDGQVMWVWKIYSNSGAVWVPQGYFNTVWGHQCYNLWCFGSYPAFTMLVIGLRALHMPAHTLSLGLFRFRSKIYASDIFEVLWNKCLLKCKELLLNLGAINNYSICIKFDPK